MIASASITTIEADIIHAECFASSTFTMTIKRESLATITEFSFFVEREKLESLSCGDLEVGEKLGFFKLLKVRLVLIMTNVARGIGTC